MEILILGANSDTAPATARRFAGKEKAAVTLASRDPDTLRSSAR
jgi:NAD(P)-dependent dehydrogenase (short-subunit alcohol dehydrogenase family)